MRLVSALIIFTGLIGCAHPPTPRERAILLLHRGQTSAALELLTAELRLHPRDLDLLLSRGHALELARRFDEALNSYDEAASVSTLPDGPREGGLRTLAWGETAAAMPRLEEAVRRGDDQPSTFHALGILRLGLGDDRGAEKAYRAGLATKKGADDATCVLGLATLAVFRKDGAAASYWYDELARRRPKLASAQLGRAYAFGLLRKKAEADQALRKALELGAKPADVDRLRVWLTKPTR